MENVIFDTNTTHNKDAENFPGGRTELEKRLLSPEQAADIKKRVGA